MLCHACGLGILSFLQNSSLIADIREAIGRGIPQTQQPAATPESHSDIVIDATVSNTANESSSETSKWLVEQGFGQYVDTFARENLDLEAIRLLNLDALRLLNIKLGDALKILHAIEGT